MSKDQIADKLDRHLQELMRRSGDGTEAIPVVIRVVHRAAGNTPAEKAADFDRGTRGIVARLTALDATITAQLWIANALSATISVAALARAAGDAEVEQIISDHNRRAL